ncbi:hypothetical protein CCACVL1_30213, partial [Corchorus capsularis]
GPNQSVREAELCQRVRERNRVGNQS